MAGMSVARLYASAAACILSSYCAQELAAFLPVWQPLQAVVPLWKVSSAPPRRRTKPARPGARFYLLSGTRPCEQSGPARGGRSDDKLREAIRLTWHPDSGLLRRP